MNEVAAKSDRVFGVMFNQRTRGDHQKLKELVESGEAEAKSSEQFTSLMTGFALRVIMTRAAGALRGLGKVAEYWPISVHITSTCGSGYAACRSASVRSVILANAHDIEVEDDVTAYAEYANGATGVFITSTGEAPGTNRLEISADNGKVVLEGGKITFWRTRVSSSQFLKEVAERIW